MSYRKIITLDLNGCKHLGELHQRIKEAFDFPDFYGANWSAFWDLLWSECDADKIEIIGRHTMPKEFDSCIDKILEILQRNKDEILQHNWGTFDFEIVN